MNKKKIVTIGGGSGQFVLLSALRDLPCEVTAVVSMTDSGGSTGRLRDELGVLPPGDVLKCLIALSPYRDVAREMFQTRFDNGDRLSGHNAGNLLLTYLGRHAGDFPSGIEAFAKILKIKGNVLPVTVDRATLVAQLDDGGLVFGETAIDRPNRGSTPGRISNVFLAPHHSSKVEVYAPVIKAIDDADFVLIGPGDLFTSIMPNLKVDGVKEAILRSKAGLAYFLNVMTKYGETDGYTMSTFIGSLEKALGRKIDVTIANKKRPNEELLNRYAEEKAFFIEPTLNSPDSSRMIVTEDLLDDNSTVLRHDQEKLAKVITELFL